MSSPLAFKILPNRDLEISLDEKFDEDEIEDMLAKPTMDALHDLFEHCRANGGPYLTDAGALMEDGYHHLTDAPMVVSGQEMPDSGHESFWGSVWWFPNYVVEDEVETLLRKGKVVFRFGHEIGKPVDCKACDRPDASPSGEAPNGDDCPACGGRGFTLVPYADEAEWFRMERDAMGAS